MNLSKVVSPIRTLAFRTWRSLTVLVPGRRIRVFGGGAGQIGAIVVINLDRQPRRWRLVTRELGRYRTSEGASLTSMTRRLAAASAISYMCSPTPAWRSASPRMSLYG
jgi:hypothetical protein